MLSLCVILGLSGESLAKDFKCNHEPTWPIYKI